MDRIVYYSEGLEPEIIQQIAKETLTDTEVLTCYSKRCLVESLVNQHELVGMIVDIPQFDEHWNGFLRSAMANFPLLPILIAHTPRFDPCPEGFSCMDRDGNDDEITAALTKCFGQPRTANRREHHRYNWPLMAELADGSGTTHRIRELSAGGAFLEPLDASPRPGDGYAIDIYFQNFKFRTRCIVLDAREFSGDRSAGFGIRFPTLSESAQVFINRVVEDAIMQVLTDPGAEPEVPTIEEEEDVLAIGDEFSLV